MTYNIIWNSQKAPMSCLFIPEICFQWDLPIPLQLLWNFLKNLNICPSKDKHLTRYTWYHFYDFLQYGLMDLVKSFFKWCMIYNFNRKSQKALMSCHFIPETELFRKQVAELCFPATLYNFIILYYRENRN